MNLEDQEEARNSLLKEINALILKLNFDVPAFTSLDTVKNSCCSILIGITERIFDTTLKGVFRKPVSEEQFKSNASILLTFLNQQFDQMFSDFNFQDILLGNVSLIRNFLKVLEDFRTLSGEESDTCCAEVESAPTFNSKNNKFVRIGKRNDRYRERLLKITALRKQQDAENQERSEALRRQSFIDTLKLGLYKKCQSKRAQQQCHERKLRLEKEKEIKRIKFKKLLAKEHYLNDQLKLWGDEVSSKATSRKDIAHIIRKLDSLKVSVDKTKRK